MAALMPSERTAVADELIAFGKDLRKRTEEYCQELPKFGTCATDASQKLERKERIRYFRKFLTQSPRYVALLQKWLSDNPTLSRVPYDSAFGKHNLWNLNVEECLLRGVCPFGATLITANAPFFMPTIPATAQFGAGIWAPTFDGARFPQLTELYLETTSSSPTREDFRKLFDSLPLLTTAYFRVTGAGLRNLMLAQRDLANCPWWCEGEDANLSQILEQLPTENNTKLRPGRVEWLRALDISPQRTSALVKMSVFLQGRRVDDESDCAWVTLMAAFTRFAHPLCRHFILQCRNVPLRLNVNSMIRVGTEFFGRRRRSTGREMSLTFIASRFLLQRALPSRAAAEPPHACCFHSINFVHPVDTYAHEPFPVVEWTNILHAFYPQYCQRISLAHLPPQVGQALGWQELLAASSHDFVTVTPQGERLILYHGGRDEHPPENVTKIKERLRGGDEVIKDIANRHFVPWLCVNPTTPQSLAYCRALWPLLESDAAVRYMLAHGKHDAFSRMWALSDSLKAGAGESDLAMILPFHHLSLRHILDVEETRRRDLLCKYIGTLLCTPGDFVRAYANGHGFPGGSWLHLGQIVLSEDGGTLPSMEMFRTLCESVAREATPALREVRLNMPSLWSGALRERASTWDVEDVLKSHVGKGAPMLGDESATAAVTYAESSWPLALAWCSRVPTLVIDLPPLPSDDMAEWESTFQLLLGRLYGANGEKKTTALTAADVRKAVSQHVRLDTAATFARVQSICWRMDSPVGLFWIVVLSKMCFPTAKQVTVHFAHTPSTYGLPTSFLLRLWANAFPFPLDGQLVLDFAEIPPPNAVNCALSELRVPPPRLESHSVTIVQDAQTPVCTSLRVLLPEKATVVPGQMAPFLVGLLNLVGGFTPTIFLDACHANASTITMCQQSLPTVQIAPRRTGDNVDSSGQSSSTELLWGPLRYCMMHVAHSAVQRHRYAEQLLSGIPVEQRTRVPFPQLYTPIHKDNSCWIDAVLTLLKYCELPTLPQSDENAYTRMNVIRRYREVPASDEAKLTSVRDVMRTLFVTEEQADHMSMETLEKEEKLVVHMESSHMGCATSLLRELIRRFCVPPVVKVTNFATCDACGASMPFARQPKPQMEIIPGSLVDLFTATKAMQVPEGFRHTHPECHGAVLCEPRAEALSKYVVVQLRKAGVIWLQLDRIYHIGEKLYRPVGLLRTVPGHWMVSVRFPEWGWATCLGFGGPLSLVEDIQDVEAQWQLQVQTILLEETYDDADSTMPLSAPIHTRVEEPLRNAIQRDDFRQLVTQWASALNRVGGAILPPLRQLHKEEDSQVPFAVEHRHEHELRASVPQAMQGMPRRFTQRTHTQAEWDGFQNGLSRGWLWGSLHHEAEGALCSMDPADVPVILLRTRDPSFLVRAWTNEKSIVRKYLWMVDYSISDEKDSALEPGCFPLSTPFNERLRLVQPLCDIARQECVLHPEFNINCMLKVHFGPISCRTRPTGNFWTNALLAPLVLAEAAQAGLEQVMLHFDTVPRKQSALSSPLDSSDMRYAAKIAFLSRFFSQVPKALKLNLPEEADLVQILSNADLPPLLPELGRLRDRLLCSSGASLHSAADLQAVVECGVSPHAKLRVPIDEQNSWVDF